MTYRLPSGDRVQAFDLGGGLFEFVTRNAAGETISTVRQSGDKAQRTLMSLQVADSIRFTEVYGMRGRRPASAGPHKTTNYFPQARAAVAMMSALEVTV